MGYTYTLAKVKAERRRKILFIGAKLVFMLGCGGIGVYLGGCTDAGWSMNTGAAVWGVLGIWAAMALVLSPDDLASTIFK